MYTRLNYNEAKQYHEIFFADEKEAADEIEAQNRIQSSNEYKVNSDIQRIIKKLNNYHDALQLRAKQEEFSSAALNYMSMLKKLLKDIPEEIKIKREDGMSECINLPYVLSYEVACELHRCLLSVEELTADVTNFEKAQAVKEQADNLFENLQDVDAGDQLPRSNNILTDQWLAVKNTAKSLAMIAGSIGLSATGIWMITYVGKLNKDDQSPLNYALDATLSLGGVVLLSVGLCAPVITSCFQISSSVKRAAPLRHFGIFANSALALAQEIQNKHENTTAVETNVMLRNN